MRFPGKLFLVRAVILAAICLAPIVASAQPGRAGAPRRRIDTTFAFNKSGELNVSVGRGEIRVTAWARSEARIVASSDNGMISMTASPDRIRLEMRPVVSGNARFEINVPIGVRVIATTNTATIDVSGTQSELTLTTVSGRISASDGAGRTRISAAAGRVTLQRLSGETRVGTLTGPLTIDEISGTLSLTTISAPTTIERADLTSFTVDAAQGNLDFSGRLRAEGTHRIETFGGNIDLRFPSDFAATIEMESLHGKLHAVDFPVTMLSRTNNGRGRDSDMQHYTINGGGTLIVISTLNGGVSLRKAASDRR